MRVLWLALAVVLADQLTKIWVKLNMVPHETIPVLGRWFRFTFTENPGMAFGLSLGSKLFLTLFSIVATLLIGVYLWHVRKGPWGYRISLALILGGALGNIIDRVFYGVLYGYAPLLYGNVVDFIHLDLWHGRVAEGVPFFGGRYLAIFPIGNIADLAIIGGVAAILIFQRRFHRQLVGEDTEAEADVEPVAAAPAEAPRPEPVATPGDASAHG